MGSMLCAVTFATVMQWVGYILVALLCLMFMIVIHELGHYTVGRALGFKIDQFAVGFGPAILKYTSKKSGILYAWRLLPLGGYCAFHGESSDESVALSPDDFNAKKPWKRILVFFAGAFFNFLSAVILISIFFMAYGDVALKVGEAKDFIGESSGIVQELHDGDIIVAIDGKKVQAVVDPSEFTDRLTAVGDEVSVVVLRGGEEVSVTVRRGEFSYIDSEWQEQTMTGYGMSNISYVRVKCGFFDSLGRAFLFAFKVVGMIFSTLGGVITGALGVGESLGGTMTAIGTIASMTQIGFEAVMYTVCVLSATLAVMNLLPIPALDGSHIIFTLIEWVRGKPINRKVENILHTVGLFLLFGLAILLDIIHFVG